MSAYTQAQSKARAAAGSVAADSLKATRKALNDWAKDMAEQLAAMPEGVLKTQLEQSRQIVLSQSAKLGKLLIEAVTEGRDASFEEVLGVWQDAAERIARLEGAPAALLGGIRSPGLTLKGAYDGLGGGASTWKTLLTGHVQNAAAEADALVQAALLKGESPMVLARKLRNYVQGAQDLTALGIDPQDLRGLPQSARGAARRMKYNAERIAFSEIHNARAEAELQHFAADPLIYAVRWETSPSRGKLSPPDICDALAHNDFYGLGPGVYPLDRVPLPPHPFDRCERFPLVREVETLEDWHKPKPLGLPRTLKAEHAEVAHGHDLTASAADRIRTQLDNLFEATGKKGPGGQITALGAYQPKIPLTEGKAGDSVGLGLGPTPGDTFFGEQIGGQGGSNEGALWKGKDGVKRYIKHYKDPAQAHGEVLANEIYARLGLGAPKATTFTHNGKLWYASEIIEGVGSASELGKLGLTAARAQKALDGFAADVLTANWDAPGLSLDNMVEVGGKVYRIDNGSAFLFRAQGGRKGKTFLNKVTEWAGFAPGAGNKNPQYAKLFQAAGLEGPDAMGKAVATQIEQILKLRQDLGPQGWAGLVDQVAPGLAAADRTAIVDMLDARTKWLETKLKDLKGVPAPVKAPVLPKTPSPHKMTPGEKKEGSKFAQKIATTKGKYDPVKYKKANAAYQEAYSAGMGKEAAEQAALASLQKAPAFVPPVAPPAAAVPAPVATPLKSAVADIQAGMTAKPLAQKYTTAELEAAMAQFPAGSPEWNKAYYAKKYHLDGKVVPPSPVAPVPPAAPVELPVGPPPAPPVVVPEEPSGLLDPLALSNEPLMAKYQVQIQVKDAGYPTTVAHDAGESYAKLIQQGKTKQEALALLEKDLLKKPPYVHALELKLKAGATPEQLAAQYTAEQLSDAEEFFAGQMNQILQDAQNLQITQAEVSKLTSIKADLAQGMTAKPLSEKYTVAELEQAMQDLPTGGKEWTKVYNAKKAKLKAAPVPAPPAAKAAPSPPAEDWAKKAAAFDATQGNMTAFKLAAKYTKAELQAALDAVTDPSARAILEAALGKTDMGPGATTKALFKDLQPGSSPSSVLAHKYDETTLKAAKAVANDFEKAKLDKILKAKKSLAQQTAAQAHSPYAGNAPPAPPAGVKSGHEAAQVLKQQLNQYITKLEEAEVKAVRKYSGSNYVAINNHLRGISESKAVMGTVKKIDAAMAKADALAEDILVQRGAGRITKQHMSDPEYRQWLTSLEGGEFIEPGYMSTSTGTGFSGDTRFRIRVPKGARGLWLDHRLSSHSNELEFLLPRGTRLKILKVTHTSHYGTTQTIIDAEVIL